MLLSADRLFPGPIEPQRRLPAILRESRKYQNEVSTRLASQVLAALHELLRGFQAANESTRGELLREVAPQGTVPELLPGENEVTFHCDHPAGVNPRAKVTVISVGEPL
jgi:hypothetical protein